MKVLIIAINLMFNSSFYKSGFNDYNTLGHLENFIYAVNDAKCISNGDCFNFCMDRIDFVTVEETIRLEPKCNWWVDILTDLAVHH